ncbi:DUF3006 domain-containing protein [Peribacillus sp. SCS-155]|uniref:DUF3006 domain-containing protein n=1 Tax=Peribacillus sedimenti TaxID=3115297 RepID=UPI003905A62E
MGEIQKGIIDRFEGEYGIVNIKGEHEGIPINLFPAESKPGDLIEIDGTMITIIDNETERLAAEVEELLDDVL